MPPHWAATPLCPAHWLRAEALNAAVPSVTSPLAFPPFLHLMKTRREDIRPSISRESTSHMFWWISAHVLSPGELRGSCCRALSAFLGGYRQCNHMGYRWQATPRHRRATPSCLIMWYSWEPKGWIVSAIMITCWNLSWSLSDSAAAAAAEFPNWKFCKWLTGGSVESAVLSLARSFPCKFQMHYDIIFIWSSPHSVSVGICDWRVLFIGASPCFIG